MQNAHAALKFGADLEAAGDAAGFRVGIKCQFHAMRIGAATTKAGVVGIRREMPDGRRHTSATRSSSIRRPPRCRLRISCSKQVGKRCDSARDLALVHIAETQAQSVWLRILQIEITAWSEQNAALANVNQQLAGIKSRGKFNPQTHATGWPRPTGTFGHMAFERRMHRCQPARVNFSHFRDVASKQPALHEFRQNGLRELVGMQVSCLLHQAQTFDHTRGRDAPADAQSGKGYFRKTINLDNSVRAVELLERRHALTFGVQTRVDVIFDDRHLIARGDFQKPLRVASGSVVPVGL